jgi:hypothetical protein
MRTSDIIARVTALCPSFAHVGHALSAPAALNSPAALVSPVEAKAAATEVLGGTVQRMLDVFGVYIVMARRADGAEDFGVADDLDDLRAELRQALIGFTVGDYSPLAAGGGRLAPYAPGLTTWREDFTTEHYERVIP